MKINLDNFILEEYSSYNSEHVKVVFELNKDQDTKRFLGDVNYTIERTMIRRTDDLNHYNIAFIPYYNDYPIGYISLVYLQHEYQIIYGILNRFRKQNLGALLLDEFSEYFLSYYSEIDSLNLKIDEDNLGSRKVADLAGYHQDSDTKYSRRR